MSNYNKEQIEKILNEDVEQMMKEMYSSANNKSEPNLVEILNTLVEEELERLIK